VTPVTLILPYPPSANRLWATRVVTPKGKRPMAVTYLTKEANEYKAQVCAIALAAGICAPILGRVKVEAWLFPNRPKDWEARQRKLGPNWDDGVQSLDLDNVNKAMLDALKNVVFEDDRRVFQLFSQRMEPDARGARVVVRVTPLTVRQPDLLGAA